MSSQLISIGAAGAASRDSPSRAGPTSSSKGEDSFDRISESSFTSALGNAKAIDTDTDVTPDFESAVESPIRDCDETLVGREALSVSLLSAQLQQLRLETTKDDSILDSYFDRTCNSGDTVISEILYNESSPESVQLNGVKSLDPPRNIRNKLKSPSDPTLPTLDDLTENSIFYSVDSTVNHSADGHSISVIQQVNCKSEITKPIPSILTESKDYQNQNGVVEPISGIKESVLVLNDPKEKCKESANEGRQAIIVLDPERRLPNGAEESAKESDQEETLSQLEQEARKTAVEGVETSVEESDQCITNLGIPRKELESQNLQQVITEVLQDEEVLVNKVDNCSFELENQVVNINGPANLTCDDLIKVTDDSIVESKTQEVEVNGFSKAIISSEQQVFEVEEQKHSLETDVSGKTEQPLSGIDTIGKELEPPVVELYDVVNVLQEVQPPVAESEPKQDCIEQSTRVALAPDIDKENISAESLAKSKPAPEKTNGNYLEQSIGETNSSRVVEYKTPQKVELKEEALLEFKSPELERGQITSLGEEKSSGSEFRSNITARNGLEQGVGESKPDFLSDEEAKLEILLQQKNGIKQVFSGSPLLESLSTEKSGQPESQINEELFIDLNLSRSLVNENITLENASRISANLEAKLAGLVTSSPSSETPFNISSVGKKVESPVDEVMQREEDLLEHEQPPASLGSCDDEFEDAASQKEAMLSEDRLGSLNSEAGPVTADEHFRADHLIGNVELNEADIDFLSKKAGAKKRPSSKIARQSLFIKFDPCLPDNSFSAMNVSQGESKIVPEIEEVVQKEEVKTESPPQDRVAALEVKPTPTRPPRAAASPSMMSVKEELSRLQDIMVKQEHSYEVKVTELEGSVKSLEEERSNLANRVAELEERVREGKYEELSEKVSSLEEENTALQTSKKNLIAIIEEYEKAISRMIRKMEQNKTELESEKESMRTERDNAFQHVANMEVAFNDIHQKYEKCKAVIEQFKRNEDILKGGMEDCTSKNKTLQSQYQKLKDHATEKLEQANRELSSIRKNYDGELAKKEATIKKLELKISSLKENIDQKSKELQEMTKICDELIAKFPTC